MSNDNMAYHRQRERHCREMAEGASNPEIRRRHEELAKLHATRAATGYFGSQAASVQLP